VTQGPQRRVTDSSSEDSSSDELVLVKRKALEGQNALVETLVRDKAIGKRKFEELEDA
jgi:hypothetical protein